MGVLNRFCVLDAPTFTVRRGSKSDLKKFDRASHRFSIACPLDGRERVTRTSDFWDLPPPGSFAIGTRNSGGYGRREYVEVGGPLRNRPSRIRIVKSADVHAKSRQTSGSAYTV
jgi:hypothetical protein